MFGSVVNAISDLTGTFYSRLPRRGDVFSVFLNTHLKERLHARIRVTPHQHTVLSSGQCWQRNIEYQKIILRLNIASGVI